MGPGPKSIHVTQQEILSLNPLLLSQPYHHLAPKIFGATLLPFLSSAFSR